MTPNLNHVPRSGRRVKGTRILYLISDLESGMAVTLLQVIRHLDRTNELLVCALASSGEATQEALRRSGAEVIVLGKRGVNPMSFPSLLRTARRFRPQLLHAFEVETNFYACLLARLMRARVVTGVHGTIGAFRWWRAPLLEFVLVATNQVVCVSSPIARKCLRRAPWVRRRLTVIPNGVDPLEFTPAPPRAADGRLTVTYVGNYHSPVKGHRDLLTALSMLDEDEAELWLVGDGPLMDETRTLAERPETAGRVRLWGRRRDVPQLLSRSDVFVLPSLSEGSPHALLEAMACALPIVATRVGSVPEILTDGVNGLLVPAGQPVAIRDAIRELARDPELRRRLGANARDRVQSGYGAEIVTQRYEGIYAGLVSSP